MNDFCCEVLGWKIQSLQHKTRDQIPLTWHFASPKRVDAELTNLFPPFLAGLTNLFPPFFSRRNRSHCQLNRSLMTTTIQEDVEDKVALIVISMLWRMSWHVSNFWKIFWLTSSSVVRLLMLQCANIKLSKYLKIEASIFHISKYLKIETSKYPSI